MITLNNNNRANERGASARQRERVRARLGCDPLERVLLRLDIVGDSVECVEAGIKRKLNCEN